MKNYNFRITFKHENISGSMQLTVAAQDKFKAMDKVNAFVLDNFNFHIEIEYLGSWEYEAAN